MYPKASALFAFPYLKVIKVAGGEHQILANLPAKAVIYQVSRDQYLLLAANVPNIELVFSAGPRDTWAMDYFVPTQIVRIKKDSMEFLFFFYASAEFWSFLFHVTHFRLGVVSAFQFSSTPYKLLLHSFFDLVRNWKGEWDINSPSALREVDRTTQKFAYTISGSMQSRVDDDDAVDSGKADDSWVLI